MTFWATMLKAMYSPPRRTPAKVMKSPTRKGTMLSGSGAGLCIFKVVSILLGGLSSTGAWSHLQCSRALERAVGSWAKGIGSAAWNAHRKSGEGRDAWTFVVRSEHWCTSVANGKDGVGITDANGRPCGNLQAAVLKVDGLDETAIESLKKLVCKDLTCDGLPVEKVANDLCVVLTLGCTED